MGFEQDQEGTRRQATGITMLKRREGRRGGGSPSQGCCAHLKKVDFMGLVTVEFRVSNARTCRSHLKIASLHDLDVAHRIPMLEFATDDVTEDLGFGMTMGTEAFGRRDAVLVDDAEGSK